MRAVVLLMLVLFAIRAFPRQGQAPSPELERVERALQALSDLKAKVAAIETQLDQMIAELSEQKGAAQNRKPAAFGGMGEVAASPADPSKPKSVRCGAMTAKGERCTRPSVPGSRYCRQHQMAHQ